MTPILCFCKYVFDDVSNDGRFYFAAIFSIPPI